MFELFESCFLSYMGCYVKKTCVVSNDTGVQMNLKSISIEEYGYAKMYLSMQMEYKCQVV